MARMHGCNTTGCGELGAAVWTTSLTKIKGFTEVNDSAHKLPAIPYAFRGQDQC